jgi:hypothetical protein
MLESPQTCPSRRLKSQFFENLWVVLIAIAETVPVGAVVDEARGPIRVMEEREIRVAEWARVTQEWIETARDKEAKTIQTMSDHLVKSEMAGVMRVKWKHVAVDLVAVAVPVLVTVAAPA